MDVLCRLSKQCHCKDRGCARSLERMKRRDVDRERGAKKLLRKEIQRAWPPGTCGAFEGRLFTIIGTGPTSDGWKAMVSFEGTVTVWDLLTLRGLTHV